MHGNIKYCFKKRGVIQMTRDLRSKFQVQVMIYISYKKLKQPKILFAYPKITFQKVGFPRVQKK